MKEIGSKIFRFLPHHRDLLLPSAVQLSVLFGVSFTQAAAVVCFFFIVIFLGHFCLRRKGA